MQEERFKIKFISTKNCFVHLPDIFVRKLDRKGNGLKLSHDNNNYYVSWRPISGYDEFLKISATFARTLGIKDGDEVVVSSIVDPPFLSSIVATPWSIEDWDIVAYQADRIQSVLLDQISLIAKNQTIVAWISKGLSVTLSIDAVHPDFPYGRIGNRTEVHVEMPKRERNFSNNEGGSVERTNFVTRTLANYIPFLKPRENDASRNKINDIETWMRKNENANIPEVFRVYNLSAARESYPSAFRDSRPERPYDVFIHEFDLSRRFVASKDRLYKIRKVREDRRRAGSANSNFMGTNDDLDESRRSTELVARLLVVEEELAKSDSYRAEKFSMISNSVHKRIYISMNLMRNLKLSVGSRVLLEPVPKPKRSVRSLDAFPSARSITKRALEKFFLDTAGADGILLNSFTRIFFEDGTSCAISCRPEQSSYFLVDAHDLKNVTIIVNDAAPFETDTELGGIDEEELDEETKLTGVSLSAFEPIIEECRIALELDLGLTGAECFRHEPGNVLICGDAGVGKSTFCKILREMMRKSPHFVYTRVIACKTLKGKKAESMQKIISAAMSECVYRQPSILFLDDLECVTNSPTGEDERTPDAINASRIFDMIINASAEHRSSHHISIVATCSSIDKVGAKLRSPRGVHPFRTIFTIPELTKERRIDILKLALGNHARIPESMNWEYCGNGTEGWVVKDLVDFAEKASFAAWKRHARHKIDDPLVLTEEDLLETLKNYKTVSLRGVRLYENSEHDWSRIGGLRSVKEVLARMFEWPIRYPEFYRDAPIKNQSGVLLYGMPGTGKTAIAGGIAKECGINLICVKGPELLSKYIGASEEAVREVFEKARRARPCVLFFDEFDSLAPRRGHDSTGVTDRVVNQLLTQLDGVEGREGVGVVAASSRPDLLDPALLRPGRLDKSLLCPLPDENEREEILKVLCVSRGIDAANLNLRDLAEQTGGFTGADLNAVLSRAKYDALENVRSDRNGSFVEEIVITREDILESLNSTMPSLSRAEKEKYQRIYEQFSGGGVIENAAFAGQKATLA